MKAKRVLAISLVLALIFAVSLSLAINAFAAETMPEAQDGEVVEVWLMAGQSNSVGYGEAYPTDEAYAEDKALLDAGVSNVWYYGKDEGTGNNPKTFVPVTFGLGQTTARSGAEIGIATALAGNGKMNAVIKLAYGSSFLYPYTTADITKARGSWTPPSYIEKHDLSVNEDKVGDLYYAFLNTVGEGLDMLKASGYTPVIKGMLFMQGEAETFKDYTAAAYQELLTTFINDIRRDLGALSGQALGEMPFALTKITKNPEAAHGAPEILAAVGEAQAAVAADSTLKNVHIIDTTAELLDPATGEFRAPSWNIYTSTDESTGETVIQHDRWHYDAITQQMIGEAAIAKINSSYGILTEYGIIPYDTTDSEYASAYFAIFGKSDSGYFFDSLKPTNKDATTRAVELAAEVGSESVMLLLKDYSSTSTSDFCTDAAQANGHIIIDLNGKTLSTSAVMRTQQNKPATKDTFVTVKDGTYLCYKYGFVYGAIRSDSTTPTAFNVEFENMTIGFSKNTTAVKLITSAEVNPLAADDETVNVNFNYYLKNCVIDMVKNRKADADCFIGGGSRYADRKQEDVTVTLEDCDIRLKQLKDFAYYRPSEGDALYLAKNSDGEWGSIRIAAEVTDGTLPAIDMGYPLTLSLTKNGGADTDGFITYDLAPSTAVATEYGNIPLSYVSGDATVNSADAEAYPFAVFYSTAGGYAFDNVYAKYSEAMVRARNLTKTDSAKEEVVVLLRRNYTSAANNDYPSYMSEVRTKVTVDLAGYTLAVPNLMNTRNNKSTVKNGEIVVKNGSVLTMKDGLLYLQIDSGYLGDTKFSLIFENAYVGFAKDAFSQGNDLAVCSKQQRGDTSHNAVFNIIFKDCVIDLKTNATESTSFGDPSRGEGATLDDVKITVEGGKILAYSYTQLAFNGADEGDEIGFSFSKMPKVFLKAGVAGSSAPDSTYRFACSDDSKSLLVFYETARGEGDMREYAFTKIEKPVEEYAFAIIGDTQYMTRWDALQTNGVPSNTQHLKQVYDWILANKDEKNIKYVMGLGDITDSYDKSYSKPLSSGKAFDTAREWEIAYEQISRLDGVVQYSVVRGNHDNENYFNQYFDNETYKSQLNGGFFSETGALNAYSIFDVGSEKYLLLALDDNPTNDVIAWAGGLIQSNSDRRVIITTHTYISYTGELLDKTKSEWNSATADCHPENGENDGKQLWEKLISKHENIVLVLCGHDNRETNILRSVRIGDNGNAVTELLICPQSLDRNEQVEQKMGMVAMLYFSNDGKDIRVEYVSTAQSNATDDGSDVYYNPEINNVEYELMALPVVTEYGNIYYEHRDASLYPISVFTRGQYIGSYSAWSDALSAASKKISGKPTNERTAEILLRGDITTTSYANTSQMGGLLIVDLDGHTLKGGNDNILSGTGKYYKDELMCDTTIKFINGTITVGKKAFTSFGIWSDRYYSDKKMDYIFENVSFGYHSGATSAYLIATSSNADSDNDINKNMAVTMTFNGCAFDLVTNAPVGAKLFDFNDTMTTIDATAYINGGEIKVNTDSIAALYTLGEEDGVRYGSFDGYTVIDTAGVLAKEYLDAALETVLRVVAVKTGDAYTLVPASLAEPSFLPKASVTLDSNLIFNIYIPDDALLMNATLDGEAIVLEGAEDGYYLVSVNLSADESAREITLAVTLGIDGVSTSGTFTFSTVKYAKKLLKMDISDEEAALAKDMLAYINSAYVFFNGSAVAEITALLDGYTSKAVETTDAKQTVPGLSGATFVLTAKPAVRFYFAEGYTYDDFTFKVGGRNLTEKDIANDDVTEFVEFSLYAYEMTETFSYTVDGESGEYNLIAYYAYVNGTGENDYKGDDKAELTDLTVKFYNYCASAKAYRQYVIDNQ